MRATKMPAKMQPEKAAILRKLVQLEIQLKMPRKRKMK
jgi:hypothetical protein